MTKTVAVIGAGGKMGARAAEKIGFGQAFRVLLCESNRERAQALEDKGLRVTETSEAMAGADLVVNCHALVAVMPANSAPLVSANVP